MEITTGRVTYVDNKSLRCRVLLPNGIQLEEVGILNTTGGSTQVEMTLLNNYLGAAVAMIELSGSYFILGTIPMPTSRVANKTTSGASTESIAFSDQQKTIPSTSTQTITNEGNIATNILPGDKVISADGGASIAVQRGGSVVVKASPLSQMILGGSDNFIKLVARDICFCTDFGEMHMGHGAGGTTFFSINGGANLKETHSTEGVNTVKLCLGSCPGNGAARSGLVIGSAENKGIYGALTLDNNGKVVIAGSNDVAISSLNDANFFVQRNYISNVKQHYGLTIEGKQYESVTGKTEKQYGDDFVQEILGNQTETTMGNRTINVSGVLTIKAAAIQFDTNYQSAGPCTFKCSALNIERC